MQLLIDDIDSGRVQYNTLDEEWKSRLSDMGYTPKPPPRPTVDTGGIGKSLVDSQIDKIKIGRASCRERV